MQLDGTIKMTDREFLLRCGMSRYEAEMTTITAIEKGPDGIRAQISRTSKHQPKKTDEQDGN